MKRFRRRFNPRPLTLRRKVLYATLVALPILAIFLIGNRGILNRFALERESTSLRSQLYRERAIGDSLRAEIVRVLHDTTALERIARERYGMTRPGEKIYHVEE